MQKSILHTTWNDQNKREQLLHWLRPLSYLPFESPDICWAQRLSSQLPPTLWGRLANTLTPRSCYPDSPVPDEGGEKQTQVSAKLKPHMHVPACTNSDNDMLTTSTARISQPHWFMWIAEIHYEKNEASTAQVVVTVNCWIKFFLNNHSVVCALTSCQFPRVKCVKYSNNIIACSLCIKLWHSFTYWQCDLHNISSIFKGI